MLMLLTRASCSAGVGALSAGGAGGRTVSPSEQLREFPVLEVPVTFVLKKADLLRKERTKSTLCALASTPANSHATVALCDVVMRALMSAIL